MLAESREKMWIGLGVGTGLMFLGGLSRGCLGSLMTIGGWATFIWGCMAYAKGKGYSPWIGLVGFFWFFGLVPLLLLTDKYRAVPADPRPGPVP